MKKLLGLGVVLALVAACDQRAADVADAPVDPTDPTDPVVAENGRVVVGDLDTAAYDPQAGTLSVQITLDGGDAANQPYDSDGTVNGYDAFEFQDGTDSRSFRAFAGESTDGQVYAVVAADGGKLNRFFGGALAEQSSFSAPDGGLLRYQGNYVGLVNGGTPDGTPPADTEASQPFRPYQTTGNVYLWADFNAPMALEGEIYNRELEDGTALPVLVLTADDIGTDGSFQGAVELDDAEFTNVGSYSGVFGGTNASSVAGVVELGAGFLPPADTRADGNEVEYGIFVLDVDTP